MGVHSVSVLVVEDEALVAADIEETLCALGYGVPATASTARDAVHLVETTRPTLVLMDIKLKGDADGIQCGELIRERFGVPVMYLTSYSDEHTLARAMKTSPYGYLLKPFTERELRTAIEVALSRYGLERRLVEAHKELSRKTALLEGVLNSIDDAIVACDTAGNVVVCNEAGHDDIRVSIPPSSWDAGGSREAPSSHGVYHGDGSPCLNEDLPLSRALRGEVIRQAELLVKSPRQRWLSVNARPMRDETGSISGSVAVSRDVTAIKELQNELRKLSLTDELTGLYNRRGFLALAEQQFRVARRADRGLILLFADVNGLKVVNDELGHSVGDRLLLDAANVLRGAFRDSDIVARLGGDEFAVLLIDPDTSSADVVKARLEAEVKHFNATETRAYRLSMSVGACAASIGPHGSSSLSAMLAEADERMYQAKEQRRKGHGSGPPVVMPPRSDAPAAEHPTMPSESG